MGPGGRLHNLHQEVGPLSHGRLVCARIYRLGACDASIRALLSGSLLHATASHDAKTDKTPDLLYLSMLLVSTTSDRRRPSASPPAIWRS